MHWALTRATTTLSATIRPDPSSANVTVGTEETDATAFVTQLLVGTLPVTTLLTVFTMMSEECRCVNVCLVTPEMGNVVIQSRLTVTRWTSVTITRTACMTRIRTDMNVFVWRDSVGTVSSVNDTTLTDSATVTMPLRSVNTTRTDWCTAVCVSQAMRGEINTAFKYVIHQVFVTTVIRTQTAYLTSRSSRINVDAQPGTKGMATAVYRTIAGTQTFVTSMQDALWTQVGATCAAATLVTEVTDVGALLKDAMC